MKLEEMRDRFDAEKVVERERLQRADLAEKVARTAREEAERKLSSERDFEQQLKVEVARRIEVRARAAEHGRSYCEHCGNEIDETVCHCGGGASDHGMYDGHSFVPMGCDCGRDVGADITTLWNKARASLRNLDAAAFAGIKKSILLPSGEVAHVDMGADGSEVKKVTIQMPSGEVVRGSDLVIDSDGAPKLADFDEAVRDRIRSSLRIPPPTVEGLSAAWASPNITDIARWFQCNEAFCVKVDITRDRSTMSSFTTPTTKIDASFIVQSDAGASVLAELFRILTSSRRL